MNTPVYLIRDKVKKSGFNLLGNSAIYRILQNPVYCGLIHVRAYREYPEEFIKGVHEPLVDDITWQEVQSRFKPQRQHVQVTDDIPLRGVLKCHCRLPLIGAASRGKGGNYYFYYKCKVSGHNNISAIKAHKEFDTLLDEIALPEKTLTAVVKKSNALFNDKLKSHK